MRCLQRRNAIALLDARSQERAGQGVDARIELRIIGALGGVHHGFRIGRGFGPMFDDGVGVVCSSDLAQRGVGGRQSRCLSNIEAILK